MAVRIATKKDQHSRQVALLGSSSMDPAQLATSSTASRMEDSRSEEKDYSSLKDDSRTVLIHFDVEDTGMVSTSRSPCAYGVGRVLGSL